MLKQYIALHSIQIDRLAIEPISETSSGLFEHDFDAKTERRLLDNGSIRLPKGVEIHEEPAPQEVLDDTRVLEVEAVPVKAVEVPVAKPVAEKVVATPAVTEATDDLDGKTVAELRAVALDETIALGDVVKKADIQAVIRAARLKAAETPATPAADDEENLLGD